MKTKERPDITALKERIKVAMAAKREAAKAQGDQATVPTEEELDALVPGSAEILNQAKAPKVRPKPQKYASKPPVHRPLFSQDFCKTANRGVIGVTKSRGRYNCVFERKHIGTYTTAVAAARAYNRAATKKYGNLAVLCDLDAAAKLDQKAGTFLR